MESSMRLELIHPLLVHFPIALLFTGIFFRLAGFAFRHKPRLSFLLPASWAILGLGIIAAWLAVTAGEVAKEIVEPTLIKLSVLERHSKYAYLTAAGFSFTFLLDIGKAFFCRRARKKGWWMKWGFTTLIVLLYVINLTNLVATGGYGAGLVYEQGAAVNCP